MTLSMGVYILMGTVFVMGIHLAYKSRFRAGHDYIRFKRLWGKNLRYQMENGIKALSGVTANTEKGVSFFYSLVRYISIAIFLFHQVSKQISKKPVSWTVWAMGALAILATIPVKEVMNKTTIYGSLCNQAQKYRKQKIDKDLFHAMTRLKNLCYCQKEKPLSGAYLIEMLLRDSQVTKPAFSKLLFSWRLGREQEGCIMFAEELDTKMAHEMSKILSKLEQINPWELTERLSLYQNHIREERMTLDLQRQETFGFILYGPVIGSAFLILLNFLIVVVLMDTMNLMKNL